MRNKRWRFAVIGILTMLVSAVPALARISTGSPLPKAVESTLLWPWFAFIFFVALWAGLLIDKRDLRFWRPKVDCFLIEKHPWRCFGAIAVLAGMYRIPYLTLESLAAFAKLNPVWSVPGMAGLAWLPQLLGLVCQLSIAGVCLALIRRKNPLVGLAVASIAMFLPPAIYQSQSAGFSEALYALALLIILWALRSKRYYSAAILWGMLAFFKIELLFLLPLLLMYRYYRSGWRASALFGLVGALALALMFSVMRLVPIEPGFLAYLPGGQGVLWPVPESAANFPVLIGGYSVLDFHTFWAGLRFWGPGVLVVCAFSGWIWGGFRRRPGFAGLLTASFVILMAWPLFFPFARSDGFLTPVVLLWLIAGYYRDKRVYYLALLLSLAWFFNLHAGALNLQQRLIDPAFSRALYILAIVNLGLFGCALLIFKLRTTAAGLPLKRFFSEYTATIAVSLVDKLRQPPFPLRRRDLGLVGLILLVYGALVFFRLGSWSTPRSGINFTSPRQTVEVRFAKPVNIRNLAIYDAEGAGQLAVAKQEGGVWKQAAVIGTDGYYVLKRQPLIAAGVRRLRFTPLPQAGMVNELGFLDEQNRLIYPQAVVSADGALTPAARSPLFDEPTTMAERPSFLNSTYFDEIYHGRTAYEFIKGYPVYETTHPPLGKDILSLGILLFGMSPFGMRFSHALMGILLMAALFFLGRQVLATRFGAYATMALGCLDFMPLVESRYSTIDTTSVFFITVLSIFTFRYLRGEATEDGIAPAVSYPTIAAVLLFFGLAVATKWTGAYAFGGTLLCFLILKFRQFLAGRRSSDPAAASGFLKNLRATLSGGLLLFIVIIPSVYYLSYLPFLKCSGTAPLFTWASVKEVIASQKWMYQYHSQLTETHPFASPWWGWPFDFKPLWLYAGSNLAPGMKEVIVSLGNPLIWLLGVISLLFLSYHLLQRRRFSVMHYAMVGLLAAYLPWTLVSRVTFIYHFYPVLPLLYVSIAFVTEPLWKMPHTGRRILLVLFVIALSLGVLFYPAIAGLEVPEAYIEKFLRWFPNDWIF